MPHVVTETCFDCRYTDCVNVCPVECFYADDKMLYIDPDECIDCEACVTECPVEAIILDRNIKDVAERTRLLKLNADRVGYLRDNDGHISDPEKAREGDECIAVKKKREAAGQTQTTTTPTTTPATQQPGGGKGESGDVPPTP